MIAISVRSTWTRRSGQIVANSLKLTSIAQPSSTVEAVEVFGDTITYLPSLSGAPNYRNSHNDGTNLAGCDGHAAWMKVATLATGQGGNQDWYFLTTAK